MTDSITLTGLVATVPHVVSTGDRVPFTSFRLASNQRYYDRKTSQWVAGETNWYTVTAFRALAVNAGASVHKGDRVIVSGRLKIRRWEAGEKNGISVDVEAESIGHDLVWGTAQYLRTVQRETEATAGAVSQERESVETDAVGAAGSDETAGESAPAAIWPVTTPGTVTDGYAASGDASDTPF